MENKNLYNLNLGESCEVEKAGLYTTALRVPGGWIFRTSVNGDYSLPNCLFIPFDTEFCIIVDEKIYSLENNLTIDECSSGVESNNEKLVIKFNDLTTIKKHLKLFKDALSKVIYRSKTRKMTDVARRAGITNAALSRILNDEKLMPRKSTLMKLTRALGVDKVTIKY